MNVGDLAKGLVGLIVIGGMAYLDTAKEKKIKELEKLLEEAKQNLSELKTTAGRAQAFYLATCAVLKTSKEREFSPSFLEELEQKKKESADTVYNCKQSIAKAELLVQSIESLLNKYKE